MGNDYLLAVHVGRDSQGSYYPFSHAGYDVVSNYPDTLRPSSTSQFAAKVGLSRKSGKELLPNLNTPELALEAIKARPISPKSAEDALYAIANLCRFDEANRESLGSAGICYTVTELMNEYRANEYVTIQALYAVNSISMFHANVPRFDAFNITELIVNAMNVFRNKNAAISHHGCGAVWNFALEKGLKDKLRKHGACEAVIDAMKVHCMTDFAVSQEGILFFLVTVSLKVIKIKVATYFICRLLHYSYLLTYICLRLILFFGIYNSGCGAIWNLALHSETNNALLGKLGACEVVTMVRIVLTCLTLTFCFMVIRSTEYSYLLIQEYKFSFFGCVVIKL